MTRSGYSDDCYGADLVMWRGAVNSAIRGKRGQAFLREMLEALDALPEKRLISHDLVTAEGCCAMGAVALKRQLDVGEVEPSDREQVALAFGIAPALAAEIASTNDDDFSWRDETPEKRFERVRAWVAEQIRTETRP